MRVTDILLDDLNQDETLPVVQEPADVEQPQQPQPQQPQPQQQAQPTPAVQPVEPSDEELNNRITADINTMLGNALQLPDDNKGKQYVLRFFTKLADFTKTLDEATKDITSDENIDDHLQTLAGQIISSLHLLPTRVRRWYADKLHAGVELTAQELSRLTQHARAQKTVQKAEASLVKTIELDTEGKIVMQDEELESYAAEVAQNLGLDYKWALNLVGMFGVSISRDDKLAFLDLCRKRKAISLRTMLAKKHGRLSDLITKTPPSIRQVFGHIKETLLGISLSTGQRDATGPFEAMLCIMGPAVKLKKGDIGINGQNYEVKGSSIGVNATGSPTESYGWLEAQKKKAGDLKIDFFKAYEKYIPNHVTTPAPEHTGFKTLKELINAADFRPQSIGYLKDALDQLPDDKAKLDVLFDIHVALFPETSIQKIKGFDFNKEIQKILNAIYVLPSSDVPTIARIQGIMGMLEYWFSSYKSGMIFYNSSLETYLVLDTPEDIVALATNSSEKNVHFMDPITMGKGDKSAPGVYFGKRMQDKEGVNYINQRRVDLGIGKMYKPRKTEINEALLEVDALIHEMFITNQ